MNTHQQKLATFLEGVAEQAQEKVEHPFEAADEILAGSKRTQLPYSILVRLLGEDVVKGLDKEAFLDEGVFPYAAAGGVGYGTHRLSPSSKVLPLLTAILTLLYLKEQKRQELDRVSANLKEQEKPNMPFS